ncbi:unnamed protein product, partial [Amoebophrya sp. A25]
RRRRSNSGAPSAGALSAGNMTIGEMKQIQKTLEVATKGDYKSKKALMLSIMRSMT